MNLIKLIKQVGFNAIKTIAPGAGLAIEAVNAFLPATKQVSMNSTGVELQEAIDTLPPAQKSEVLNKKYDFEIIKVQEANDTLRTMLAQDAITPHTTRPFIAKWSFILIAVISLIVVIMWAVAVGMNRDEMVKEIMDGWAFIGAITSPFVALLYAYFGVIKKEQENKLNVAGGFPIVSGITKLMSKFK